ncbi:RsfA family transcriptional regulator [Paenibacillus spiritus]|uniref:RsfA family transcriptional regulator n=1 Tax=Paenibacillus spiritus TaxID=2496557 RepID=A0A5J5GHP9_9BACL|nr:MULTISPECIES: RsfA family transcriptional regulator [Paenibacillus]KAA9007617.1 RsfA family transcriptional regulator [Paenibacillus spiritus]
MTAVRQDAWSTEDDLTLAEITLRHIREGSTQLAAFEEVGEKIGRTSAACGFRWNSCVRKNYEEAIGLAKSQRQKKSQLKKQTPVRGAQVAGFEYGEESEEYGRGTGFGESSLSIDAVIRFLRQWKGTYNETGRQLKMLERDLRDKEEELADLKRENERLSKEVHSAQSDYRVVNDDYKALIQIMDRARRLAFLSEEDEELKTRFKMDANGNLERID